MNIVPGRPGKGSAVQKTGSGGNGQLIMDGSDPNFLQKELEINYDGRLPEEHRQKLHQLFAEVEREFERLYLDNLRLRGQIESQSEKIPFGLEKSDSVDIELVKPASSKVKGQPKEVPRFKPGYRLKAQTSKIVSSFKGPSYSCTLVREYRGHRDGIWEISTKPGIAVFGTASADFYAGVWSIDNGRCLLQYQGHSGSVNSIKFHPNRDLVLTASGDHTCHVWQLAISQDQLKATSSEDELDSINYFDERPVGDDVMDSPPFCAAPLRTPVCELNGHKNVVIAADWLSGGDQIISASWDRTAILYDLSTMETLQTLSGHDEELTFVSAHSKNRLALTSSKDTTFRLWDFRDMHSVRVFQGHIESVNCAVFAGDDKIISGSDDKSVKIWDLKNMRTPLHAIRVDSAVNRMSVAPSNHIAIPMDNRNVLLYDITGHRLGRIPRNNRQGHRRMVCSTAWTDESLGHKCNLLTCGFDKEVLGWNVQPGKDSKD